jgi:hypothetical protein
MESQRIIYQNETGSLTVIIPCACGLTVDEIAAKDVPPGVPYQIVDACDIPADRLFRGAWVADEMGHIGVDIDRARAVAHDLRRADRQERLAPLDHLIAAQIPGPDAKAAEAKRASIRAENASQQAQIDAAKNEAALRAALGVV